MLALRRVYELEPGEWFEFSGDIFILSRTTPFNEDDDKIPCVKLGFIHGDGELHLCSKQFEQYFDKYCFVNLVKLTVTPC